jgi:outer membrane translocation and assembly module TamA
MGTGKPAGRIAPLLLVALLLPTYAGAADPGYAVKITGPGSDAVADTVNQVSDLVKRAGGPVPTAAILAQRAERDRGTIDEALRALGYYDDRVEIAIDDKTQPMAVTITIDPGPLHHRGLPRD